MATVYLLGGRWLQISTRFYLPLFSQPYDFPGPAVIKDAGWESTGSAKKKLLLYKTGAGTATAVYSDTVVDVETIQYVSEPLAAQTISGTVKGMIGVKEAASTDDFNPAFVAHVVTADGQTNRGTLLASYGGGTEFPITTLSSVKFPGGWTGAGAALSSVDAQWGDRLVIEIGYRHTTGASAGIATFEQGSDNTKADYSETEGSTGGTPWIEFSADLNFISAEAHFYTPPLPPQMVGNIWGYPVFTLPRPLVVGGVLTDVVLQASETDLAQAITRIKSRLLAEPLELDTAQAITPRKSRTLGQPSETDLAQALTARKTKLLGQSFETDLAQTIIRSGVAISVGQAAETDLAQPITHYKTKAVGQALESDTAQPVRRVLAQAFEADVAFAITPRKSKTLGQALETDLAQAIKRVKVKMIAQVAEADTAQPLTAVGGAAPSLLASWRARTRVGL